MELKDFVGQPCKSRLAFEFIPRQAHSIDLNPVAQALQKKGVILETQVPFLLTFRLNGFPVSFFRSGKIIVKNTNDPQEAKKIALDLIGLLPGENGRH